MVSLVCRFCMYVAAVGIIGCVSSPRYTSTKYVVSSVGGTFSMVEEGIASYYGDEFDGRVTASGEIFDKDELTAAHKTLPFDTIVKVTNLNNKREVIVRINDRGPYKEGRIIDLSEAAAERLRMIEHGMVKVRIEVIELGDVKPKQR